MQPSILTVLATYKCTAACKECCFECSPQVQGRIPLERILNYIGEACDTVPTLKLVVFSGGECFLLGKDLDTAVAHATGRGKLTRVVTNGYWAHSLDAARRRLGSLKESGLGELNISTGDDHQEYVPFERVVNGAIAGAEMGLTSLIVVEGFENSAFTIHDAYAHPRLKAFRETHPNGHRLQLMRNIWMPFHKERELEHTETIYRKPERIPLLGGCDNVLHNMVVTPDEHLASCCGLTMEHIPEMKLGKLAEHSISDLVKRGLDDFLKRWIWLDGPDAVLWFARQKDPRVPYPDKNVHPCEACAQFYLNPMAREAVRNHWKEIADDVLLRYELKVRMLAEQDPVKAARNAAENGTDPSHGRALHG
ncbi:radical SAM protein [Paenibacillus ginsengarvi]|uniref:Radical SAM protein n=1 Tax=Paenibacillus ginsengarvi TaxID=400777 RepID=A0A3B0BNB6_9BACL|nr:radical SAM protein [Paenibacillus ginsengarvi]RKN74923.1 radical SAM protein [Paenibacillus ginsengarvi]